jgi:chorismate mutase
MVYCRSMQRCLDMLLGVTYDIVLSKVKAVYLFQAKSVV